MGSPSPTYVASVAIWITQHRNMPCRPVLDLSTLEGLKVELISVFGYITKFLPVLRQVTCLSSNHLVAT